MKKPAVQFMVFSAIAVSAFVATSAFVTTHGQDVPRYTPQRPTVSPYLNLLRNDNGALPNYHSLVRPQLNQLSYDRQMSRVARSQSLQIQSLSEVAGETTAGPTGTGSVFNNRSHYFPRKQMSGRR